MSILSQITIPEDRAIIATITGDAGIGKTSFAATFPDPIFIRAEDGLTAFPKAKRPPAFPLLESSEQIFEQLYGLYKEQHQYKTVIIDPVTQLDTIFQKEIIENDPSNPKSINQANGGYGNGLQAVAALHQRVRAAAGKLNNDKGMNVVFVAHSTTVKVEPPDHEPYTRYELRMDKRGMSCYVDNVDLVGFLKLETFVLDDKAKDQGNRILVVKTCASHISKNRFGITQDLPFKLGENPLKPFVGSLQ